MTPKAQLHMTGVEYCIRIHYRLLEHGGQCVSTVGTTLQEHTVVIAASNVASGDVNTTSPRQSFGVMHHMLWPRPKDALASHAFASDYLSDIAGSGVDELLARGDGRLPLRPATQARHQARQHGQQCQRHHHDGDNDGDLHLQAAGPAVRAGFCEQQLTGIAGIR